MSGNWIGLYSPGTYAVPTPDMLDLTDGRLIAYGGGERRDDQRDWISADIRELARRAGLPIMGGDGKSYLKSMLVPLVATLTYPRVAYRIRRDGLPPLNYARYAEEDFKLHGHLARNVPFMVGLPSPHTLPTFGGVPHAKTEYEEAYSHQVKRLAEVVPPDRLVIQWELPLEVIQLANVPTRLLDRRARHVVEPIFRVIRQAPTELSWAFHVCWGDMGNKPNPLVRHRPELKVALINALVDGLGTQERDSVWNTQRLFAIHDPHGDGTHPPSVDPADYHAYRDLYFPGDATYAAGILTLDQKVQGLTWAANVVADAVPARRLAIATPCGDGRLASAEIARTRWSRAVAALRELDSVAEL